MAAHSTYDTSGNRPNTDLTPGDTCFIKNTATHWKVKDDGTDWEPDTTAIQLFVGFNKITVGTTQPSSPSLNDIWIDTN